LRMVRNYECPSFMAAKLLSPVINYVVKKFTPTPFVRKVAKTDDRSLPPITGNMCTDELGLRYER